MSEWCKFKQARLWTACEGTGDSTGGRAHSPRVSCVDQGVQHECKFLLRTLGYVHSRQPTVILRVFLRMFGYAHSGQPTVILGQRKVNAWTCARHSTDHDLESVFVKFQRECLDMCLSDNRP